MPEKKNHQSGKFSTKSGKISTSAECSNSCDFGIKIFFWKFFEVENFPQKWKECPNLHLCWHNGREHFVLKFKCEGSNPAVVIFDVSLYKRAMHRWIVKPKCRPRGSNPRPRGWVAGAQPTGLLRWNYWFFMFMYYIFISLLITEWQYILVALAIMMGLV